MHALPSSPQTGLAWVDVLLAGVRTGTRACQANAVNHPMFDQIARRQVTLPRYLSAAATQPLNLGMPRQARPTDVVKEELSLSNRQYEAIYTAFAAKMQEKGLIGAQMRSIQSKVMIRRIGAEIKRDQRKVLGRVSDATFDANVLRIAQRINSNIRRVRQRRGEIDIRRKRVDGSCDIPSQQQHSPSQDAAERTWDVWTTKHPTSGGKRIDELCTVVTRRKDLSRENHMPDTTARDDCDTAQLAEA